MENNTEAPQKAKIELLWDPAIPLLGLSPKECKSGNNKDTCTAMFTVVLSTIARIWKEHRSPTTDE
jgi:hypothetical protein